jgi:hypothetical protein
MEMVSELQQRIGTIQDHGPGTDRHRHLAGKAAGRIIEPALSRHFSRIHESRLYEGILQVKQDRLKNFGGP